MQRSEPAKRQQREKVTFDGSIHNYTEDLQGGKGGGWASAACFGFCA